jgi:hypothetical protein
MTQRYVPMLSKSRFLAGLHCPLNLWYQCYNRDLASEVSPAQQAIFDMGHEVGRLATQLYPGGVLIEEDHLHHKEAVQSTLAAMKDPSVAAIYEAAFISDGVRIRVDILERLNDGAWNLIEVKSATSVKDLYLPDVAVQYHVLKGSGLNILTAAILHLNNQYVYDGNQLDLNGLFTLSDLTGEVHDLQEKIPSQLAGLKGMLAEANPPAIYPSKNCISPYKCGFWEFCTAEMPKYWVMRLGGISQTKFSELIEMGIEDISHIPDSFPLSALQSRMRDCVANREEYIDPDLLDELMDVEYPIHFLDFETMGTAIPRYAGTRPYQTIPFQWSDHVLYRDGTLEHREYLCEEDKDPREEFVNTLIEGLGERGTIFIYTTYEKGVLNGVIEHLPKYEGQLLAIIDRFKDLHATIRRCFYHPDFQGSFSLKSVLPAVLPAMSYETLSIQEGSQASVEYFRMLDPATSSEEREKIKKDLLDYCGHDTLAMVRIREELLSRF